MVGLHSAIRGQRRDDEAVSSEAPELDLNLIDRPFTDKLDPFNSSLHEFEDLDFIDDWICDPDCFEMADMQTNFDTEVEAAKISSERKHVCEEFSPICLKIEAEGTLPNEVDNVGAMFGEVCWDWQRGFLLENAFFEHPIAETGCRVGKTEWQDEETECPAEKTECPSGKDEIPLETMNNVTSCNNEFSGVSGAGPLPRPKEEYVEQTESIQGTEDTTGRTVSEKSEVYLNRCRGFDHLVANAEYLTVKTEENCMETSHNVTTSRNGFLGILTADSIFRSNEENVGKMGLVQGTGDITERNVLEKGGVCLVGYRGLEHLGVGAQCPSGEGEEIPMQTSKNATTNGDRVSELSITCPNDGSVERASLVQLKNTKMSRKDDSDVESGEIVSEDDGEECTGMTEPDCKDCIGMVEQDEEDCIGMVEPDSEYCSDSLMSSSDSDYSEEEEYVGKGDEGEIKPRRGRRKLQEETLDYDFGSNFKDVSMEPIRLKHELQTNFDTEVEATKETSERKQVSEEFSPFFFNRDAGGSSPNEVDNVGAMFGEVCLDGQRGVISESAFFEHPIAETGCSFGKIEWRNEETECPAGKDEEIPLETRDNVASCNNELSGVSGAGHFSRPKEEYVQHTKLVQGTEDITGRTVSEKSEVCLNHYRSFDHLVANVEYLTVKTEENCMETSQNVTTSGNGFLGILTADSTFRSNNENVGKMGLIQGTGDITERNVLEKVGICLVGYRGLEHLGVGAQCPSGKGEETPMQTSKNATISGNRISELSITGPNEGSVECASVVQSIGHRTENKIKGLKNTSMSRRDDSDVESGEIVSEDDGEECTGMMEPDCKDCTGMLEPVCKDCTGIMEQDKEDFTDMVEADSEYCSDSPLSTSDSDYSEEDGYEGLGEEGEIKPHRGRRKLQAESLDYDFGSKFEEVSKGPLRLKHELQVLPPVPPVNVVLNSHHQTQPAGVIISMLGTSIVVEGRECHAPLNEGTILWLTEKRVPLGFIDEVFGPVKNPFYIVRFNSVNDVPDSVKEGVHVSYVPQFASYVLNDPNLYKKGYDASCDNDEELSEEVEFSDDEKESEYKREKLNAKRGAKSSQNVQEMDNGRACKKPEFMDRRKNKFVGDSLQHNANHANGPKWRAQEVKFTLKKPFGNSLCNGPSVSANQTKDYSRPGVPAFQRMFQPIQSRGGHQYTGINRKQKPSRHLGPQGGSVKQRVILSTESGYPRQGPNLFSGAPFSRGRMNRKPNHTATRGINPVQPSVVAGQPVCGGDYKTYSSNADRSVPLHDWAQVSHLGQSHSQLIHVPMGQTSQGQHHIGPLHDPLGQTSQGEHHTGPLHDPMGQIPPEQPQFRPPCGPAQGFHPAAGINLGQLPGGPMSNGKQISVNPTHFPQMPIHPTFLGQPAQNSSIQQAIAFMAWNAGQSNHVAGGSQLPSSNANQGAANPLNFNQMHTCVGIPILQQPGLCHNMGAFPGHNVMPCSMPWGQQTVLQASPNQQFQTHLPSQGPTVPLSQPNNISANMDRPPCPSQAANDRPLQHN